jgi:hypothetical protein
VGKSARCAKYIKRKMKLSFALSEKIFPREKSLTLAIIA